MIIEIQALGVNGVFQKIVSEEICETILSDMRDKDQKFVTITGRDKINGVSSTMLMNKDVIMFLNVLDEDSRGILLPPPSMSNMRQ